MLHVARNLLFYREKSDIGRSNYHTFVGLGMDLGDGVRDLVGLLGLQSEFRAIAEVLISKSWVSWTCRSSIIIEILVIEFSMMFSRDLRAKTNPPPRYPVNLYPGRKRGPLRFRPNRILFYILSYDFRTSGKTIIQHHKEVL